MRQDFDAVYFTARFKYLSIFEKQIPAYFKQVTCIDNFSVKRYVYAK